MSEPTGCFAENEENTPFAVQVAGELVQEPLAAHTTLRVGGPAARFATAVSDDDVIRLVCEADERGEPVLVLGGGSNLVVGDGGFDGLVVKIATRGRALESSECSGVTITVKAGESWDAFVAATVANNWVGLECLSGIPGTVGASPIQNIGAYGAEVAQTLARVLTWDRRERAAKSFPATECGFAYRTSRFKEERYDEFGSRYVVLGVSYQLEPATMSTPIAYAELAATLGVEVGQRVSLAAARDAVVAIRARKGMVLDSSDHDTWSAGSFFTNPIIEAGVADTLPAEAPRYLTADGRIKTSAAWLIEHAGFPKGFALAPHAPASVSTKHTLALTNRGTARAVDILALAARVADGVEQSYGIRLSPEPVLINAALA